MSQITLYLDEATESLLNQAAQASGLSKSRWVAELIRDRARLAWPVEVKALAGAFGDFPLRNEQATEGLDAQRIGF